MFATSVTSLYNIVVMADALGEVIAKIKDRLDILEVVSERVILKVSERVILKKSGSHYWGLCPFHKEKTPSFSVNPSLGIYKCFSCGEGGDAISFLMKIDGKSFMEVIRDLAEKFGYELPASGGGSSAGMRELKEQMVKACAKAADYYTTYLLQDKSDETNILPIGELQRILLRNIILDLQLLNIRGFMTS